MRWLGVCFLRLCWLFDKERLERELAAEMQSHLEMHMECFQSIYLAFRFLLLRSMRLAIVAVGREISGV